jgi:hypothetical protein
MLQCAAQLVRDKRPKRAMANEPKPGTPDYVWIDPVAELQSLVSDTDPLYDEYLNVYRGAVDLQCVEPVIFCANNQPPAISPSPADFVSGDYLGMGVQYALAIAYARICQEIFVPPPEDVMLAASIKVSAAEFAAFAGNPKTILPAPTDGSYNFPVYLVAQQGAGTARWQSFGPINVLSGTTNIGNMGAGTFANAVQNWTEITLLAQTWGGDKTLFQSDLILESDGGFANGDSDWTFTLFYLNVPALS